MGVQPQLNPARELAKNNGARFPNESEEYRRAAWIEAVLHLKSNECGVPRSDRT